MSWLVCLLVVWMAVKVAGSSAVPTVAKRHALSDLSGGFCRNYKFGATIADNVLYMVGLDGGIVPDDNDASHNYLVEVDLARPVNLRDGSNFKLSLISSDVPNLKDQALWSNQDNTTLFSYGGRGASNTSADDGVWTYTVSDGTWELQQTSVKPVRLSYGAHVDVPEIQAAYWIGGYQSSDTTLSITDDTKVYATGMIQFNTTTQEFSLLDAPFTPVQEGALVHIPVGELGVLVYFGGEVPSVQSGTNAELTPNTWNYVQIYDIASGEWYNQTTTGDVRPRTQFCASVVHDSSSSSFQIYVISGADFETQDIITGVSYLSIPSFKWYKAGGLTKGRMTHTCQAYGRQIFGLGGRQAWADNFTAGCYDTPAFIYDAQSEVVRMDFDPGLSTYSIPSATAEDIERSPYPSSWADPALQALFQVPPEPSWTPAAAAIPRKSKSTNTGAIAGGVVGGIAGVAILLAVIWFIIRSRRRKALQRPEAASPIPLKSEQKTDPKEMPVDDAFGELDERNHARTELGGDTVPVHELDATTMANPR
ncbi:putative cell wall anchored protein [Aspergillus lucknowensis]|uniref:Kelch repeat protein n=1 Tax=Aspergillus lucknowensis TaxID=176173 RepID=A0ABR4LKL2_9EURO